jgi:hypothetical protein
LQTDDPAEAIKGVTPAGSIASQGKRARLALLLAVLLAPLALALAA